MNKVLFACAENAGRSQIASAWFNHQAKLKGLAWQAESSGTFPAASIHPNVVTAMKQQGIDLSGIKPQKLVDEELDKYDKLISFGCIIKAALPTPVQNRVEEWHIDDPRDQSLDIVLKIRNEIEARVDILVKDITENQQSNLPDA